MTREDYLAENFTDSQKQAITGFNDALETLAKEMGLEDTFLVAQVTEAAEDYIRYTLK